MHINTVLHVQVYFTLPTDLYEPTGQKLGEGATGSVATYRRRANGEEYAVKVLLVLVFTCISICYGYCKNYMRYNILC